MLETVVKKEIIFYVMGILMVFGIFAKLVFHFTVRRMVKAAGEIQKSNHRLMKLVKAKFEHASMISDRVQNVEAFVDKYIYEYRVLGLRLGAWRLLLKKVLWAISILGVLAIFESYRMEGVSDLMLQYVQWTGVFILSLLLFGFVAEENTRLDATKNYMVEYLENVCIHRYAVMNHAVQETEDSVEECVALEEHNEEISVETSDIIQEDPDEQKKNDHEMRIRAILEEFLA
jgi:hypothetical protein